ncbi:ribonuclease [Oxobacter pfennigii]|uniref:Ribonuclease n=1 Tax=Oxobacter pfennigii TaxID=36849 RepID=A0A0P8WRA1_9CLOT|nr:MBL fold metallo-hydrolase [Oxobacter pfennigii]KPU45109.1 ribonuclease [Oxobacter pfennigii]
MKIRFLGAARTVTGSCYYLEAAGRKFLVDCGMFQGNMAEHNSENFRFFPGDIDFMILTHAHIDHSGRIPLLVKKGFTGSIYCTSATAELIGIMLKDSGHIQEMEAQWETKKRLRKGLDPVEPLYTVEDAEKVAKYVVPVTYNKTITIDENISLTLKDAGHLLGSAIIILNINDEGKKKTITFTGDLGNVDIPIIRNYEYIDGTDYLITESTYGDRLHEMREETQSLYDIIINTMERGGNLVIPSFAVGRTQELLYILNYYLDIEKRHKLENVQIFMDSPLAIKATEIFEKHKECYDEEALKVLESDVAPLNFSNLNIIEKADDSKLLNNKKGIVIISSSGMCEAGRIKHHLKHNLWRKEATIAFVGYQAEGTLGRRILEGEKSVTIFGEKIAVLAEVECVPGLSGHADLNGILKWVKSIKNGVKKKIFITHGDAEAAENLKEKLKEVSNAEAIVPDLYETFEL